MTRGFTQAAVPSIFHNPITGLVSIQCILIEILSRAHRKEKKGLYDFRFSAFTGHFQSDGTESMAVKGLRQHFKINNT